MIRLTGPHPPFPAVLLSLLLIPLPARNGIEPPFLLPFQSAFAGVDATGSCVWGGRLEIAEGGRVHIALQQVEQPEQAANPVWHVRTHWDVVPGSGTHAFEAELEGMVDWKAGEGHLSGIITSGWRKGTWVQADTRIVQGDIAGSLRVLPALARH